MRWYALAAVAVIAISIPIGYRYGARKAEPPGLRGLATLDPDTQARVRAVLDGADLAIPADIAALRGQPQTLMGAATAPPFWLIAPVGTAVTSDRPTFAWEPLGGGDDYTLTIVDDQGRPIGRPIEARGPFLVLQETLPRGRDYTWQVSATRGGARVTVPAPPAPPAKFRVLDKATADGLAAIERTHAESHVLLGILYLQAGALLDSMGHFYDVPRDNPHAALARRTLGRLASELNPSGAPGSDRSAPPATPAPAPRPATP